MKMVMKSSVVVQNPLFLEKNLWLEEEVFEVLSIFHDTADEFPVSVMQFCGWTWICSGCLGVACAVFLHGKR